MFAGGRLHRRQPLTEKAMAEAKELANPLDTKKESRSYERERIEQEEKEYEEMKKKEKERLKALEND